MECRGTSCGVVVIAVRTYGLGREQNDPRDLDLDSISSSSLLRGNGHDTGTCKQSCAKQAGLAGRNKQGQ